MMYKNMAAKIGIWKKPAGEDAKKFGKLIGKADEKSPDVFLYVVMV
jgi:hypothetical protein